MLLAPFIAEYKKARGMLEEAEISAHPNQMKKKALLRREQDSKYGWLTIDTADFKVD
jgi:hypothetical protein